MDNSKLFKLAHALIRQGTLPEEAFKYAGDYLTSAKPTEATYMAVLAEVKKTPKFTTIKQAAYVQQRTKKPKTGKDREIQIGTEGKHYVVHTSLPTNLVKGILIDTLKQWIEFARGATSLGGERLKHPSGRYAASLSANQTSADFFTIFSSAPYADALETGHRQVNLKKYINSFSNNHGGRYVDIPLGKNNLIRRPGQIPIRTMANSSKLSARGKVNTTTIQNRYDKRYQGKIIRRMSINSTGWIIPPMRAYHPAYHLWLKMRKEFSTMRTV